MSVGDGKGGLEELLIITLQWPLGEKRGGEPPCTIFTVCEIKTCRTLARLALWIMPTHPCLRQQFIITPRHTHLYIDMFSISWLDALSYRIIPLGDTFNVTFWSFFPLAFACKKRERQWSKTTWFWAISPKLLCNKSGFQPWNKPSPLTTQPLQVQTCLIETCT